VGGDDLYSREPLCLQLIELNLDFIFVCKPSSHPTTQEWVDFWNNRGLFVRSLAAAGLENVMKQILIRDGEDASKVNWCEITTVNEKGKVLYQNSFITSLVILVLSLSKQTMQM